MYRFLIVEDEENIRAHLAKIVKEIDQEAIVYEAESAEEALGIIKKEKIDLFCLDIHLKDSSGLQLATKLREMEEYKFAYIVFITTYIQHMISAFKQIHCYDFILKPFNEEEVKGTFKTLLERIEIQGIDTKIRPYILFDLKQFTLKIFTDDIIFIEVNKRIASIHTEIEVYEIPNTSLKKIIKGLPKENFIQSHRSFVINLNYVERIHKIDNYINFQGYEKKALLGNRYRNRLIEKLKAISLEDREWNNE